MKTSMLLLAALLGLTSLQGCQASEQDTSSNGRIALQGMFRYMADAAVFRDCRNGKSYPVSMEGAYLEVEKAYLNSGIKPGSEVMIELDGRLLERPSMEGNHNIVKIIPDTFKALYVDKSCEPEMNEALTNTYWKLVEIDGQSVVTADGQREAHMVLEDNGRVRGNGGCNNFFGGYEHQDERLTFGAMGSTMMACPQGMEMERAFLGALETADSHRISGLFMTLYQHERPLARFEAIHF